MHTGRADAGETANSVDADGWTYSVPIDVAWVDGARRYHDGGRPDCLDPGESSLIRFAATEVSVEGTHWRPVVWVACPRWSRQIRPIGTGEVGPTRADSTGIAWRSIEDRRQS